MACRSCGGAHAIAPTRLSSYREAIMGENTVRLQYTGPHAGSVSFTAGDHSYRAGRLDPFLDVLPAHVDVLLATGVFARVEAPKVEPPADGQHISDEPPAFVKVKK